MKTIIDLVGYEFYQTSFTVALCTIPFVFWKYTIVLLTCYIIYKLLLRLLSFYEKSVDISGRGVFITGCDSGLGFAFAKHLDKCGFVVFAGCLNVTGDGASRLRDHCSKRLHLIQVDITNQQSVATAFTYVQRNLPRNGLWGIVNNAGINMFGEVELTPVQLYERGFNVNLFGPIRILRKFLVLIRRSKGRIVNITSVHGQMTLPGQSNYETAKHGIETLTDSLRLEMVKFGVKVSIVEPGMYGRSTSIQNEAVVRRQALEIEEMWENASANVKETYSKGYMLSWLPKPAERWPPNDDVTPVVNAVHHALVSETPKTRYLVDGIGVILPLIDEYAVLARVYNLLPTWVTMKAIASWRNCYKNVK